MPMPAWFELVDTHATTTGTAAQASNPSPLATRIGNLDSRWNTAPKMPPRSPAAAMTAMTTPTTHSLAIRTKDGDAIAAHRQP